MVPSGLHAVSAQVEEEQLDGSVVNLAAHGLQEGAALPRGGERVSLTVRRAAKTVGSFLLKGRG